MLEVPVQRTTKMLDAPPIEMDLNGNRATGTISLPSRSESWQERISSMGWLSTSIVHDLRNPLGTVCAGAEMLMQLDPASTEGKRLAANIYRAAVRMRGLGLGLALSRQTVLDHGGDIWTEPAKGARFVICLPLSRVSTGAFNGTPYEVTEQV